MIKARYWVVVCLLVGAVMAALPSAEAQSSQNVTSTSPVTLPLVFERNGGQVPSEYGYVARRGGTELLFVRDGVDIFVAEKGSKVAEAKLRVVGASDAGAPQGVDALAGRSNYLRGADATKWVTGVEQFGRLRFAGIYDGVDLEFHGTGEDLENDFLVAAGADPRAIRLSANAPVRVNAKGDLEIVLGASVVTLRKPVAYQMVAEKREEVPAKYRIGRGGKIGFELGAYNHEQPLLIDPVFGFSTYLAGSNMDQINAVTTDALGNVYVTGTTLSVDFPVAHAEQPTCSSCSGYTDVFVSKCDPTGHTLLLSTFLGGQNTDQAYGIGVDSNSNILVAGISSSSDFPKAGSLKPVPCQLNGECFFATSLKPDGSGLNYSGLVGGSPGSYLNSPVALAVDASGNAYLSGITIDPNFQFTSGSYSSTPPTQGSNETFIMKLDPTGKLVYSTGIPGTNTSTQFLFNANSFGPFSILVDASGNATIAGTGGLGLPTTSGVLLPTIPPQQNQDDPAQGFALQINASGTAVNFGTYIPGADNVFGIALDGSGNFLLTGYTEQTTLPVSSNAYQKTIPASALGPGQGGFVLKMNGLGTATLGGTYLASPTASGGVLLHGIALDNKGNIFVGGNTGASDFPLVNPITAVYAYPDSASLVLAEFSADFSTLEFGSYLSSTDQSGFGATNYAGIAVDAQGNLIATGNTVSQDYPTTTGSFQPTPPPPANPQLTYAHGVISKIDMATGAPSVCFASQYVDFGTVDVNTPTPGTLTLTNCGNAALTISSVKSSSTTVTVGAGCASVAAGATCGIPLTFTATDTSTTTGAITLTDNAAITTQTVQFTGAGGTPMVTLPTSVTASDALVGTTVAYAIPFINFGNAPWVVSSVTATGDFTVTNKCTSPVPGEGTQQNNSCQILYTFTPTAAGARTGTLTIADNQAGSPHAIPISGNGLTSYTVPTITNIDAIPNDEQLTLFYVAGTNFFPVSQAIVNGATRTTTYLDENTVSVALTTADLAQPGELTVTISNPFPGGGVSNSFLADVYGAMRKANIVDSVFDAKTGHIFATVAAGSTSNAGQVIEIDPVAVSVVNAWTVGGGPDHLAISDDDSLLYVGLDTDHTVAQVALPGGTVNFAVALPTLGGNPTDAGPMRVLPGKPHSWVVAPCSPYYGPCGSALSVYDDSTPRATTATLQQSLPDQLLFIGTNAATLYGTTAFQQLPNLYAFSIGTSGITLTNTAPTTNGFPGGGMLDTDGTLIYSSNGQIIDPATLTISNTVHGIIKTSGIKVDTGDAQIYYVGQAQVGLQYPSGIAAFGLSSLKANGAITFPENEGVISPIYRYGANGLATLEGPYNFFFQTSLTGTAIAPSQITVTGWAPATVAATAGDVTVAVAGKDFAAGDTATANGTAVTAIVTSSSQMSIVIPAAIVGVGGNVTVVITGTQGHTASLVVAVTGSAQPVASVSPTSLTFGAQFVGSTSTAQMVTITNTGGGILTPTDIVTLGDFGQTHSCTGLSNGESCALSVTFTPTATGSRTSTMTLQFNGGDVAGATVNLSGTGTGLQIAAASGGSTSATVSSGQPAMYSLTIAPQNGFTGMVSFTCSGLPLNASCSIIPSSVTFGTTPANVTVTIATEMSTAGAMTPVANGPWFGAGKPDGMVVLAFAAMVAMGMAAYLWMASLVGRKLRMIRVAGTVVMTTLALVGLAALVSCGGGSGGGGSTSKTPAGTYTVNFVATSGGGTATQALTLTVK